MYVTHDQEEALTMSDRIAVMNRGRIEQLGTPEELYDRPATRFVADFIGTTNLLHGTVEALEAECAIVLLESGDRCRIGRPGRETGQSVDVSLRPESVTIRALDPHVPGNAPSPVPDGVSAGRDLIGSIQQSAYLGAAVQYQVLTNGGIAMTVLASKSVARLGAGQAVILTWPPAEALVLGDRPAGMEEAP